MGNGSAGEWSQKKGLERGKRSEYRIACCMSVTEQVDMDDLTHTLSVTMLMESISFMLA